MPVSKGSQANQLKQAIQTIAQEMSTLPKDQQDRIAVALRTIRDITGFTVDYGKAGSPWYGGW